MTDKLNEWLNRPAINKSGVAFELGIKHVQYFNVMISRGSISKDMKQKLIDGLQNEIEAAQNLQNLLKEKH